MSSGPFLNPVGNRQNTVPRLMAGTDAVIPLTGNIPGDLYLATDTRILYRWTGAAWTVALDGGPEVIPPLDDVLTAGNTTNQDILFTDGAGQQMALGFTGLDVTDGTRDAHVRPYFIYTAGSNGYAGLESSLNYGRVIIARNNNLSIIERDPNSTAVDTNFILTKPFTPVPNGNEQLSLQNKSIVTKSANYTATIYDKTILVDTTAGDRTITLPTDNTQIYNVKKLVAANRVIIVGSTGLVDGAANVAITLQYASLTLQSNLTDHFIL